VLVGAAYRGYLGLRSIARGARTNRRRAARVAGAAFLAFAARLVAGG